MKLWKKLKFVKNRNEFLSGCYILGRSFRASLRMDTPTSPEIKKAFELVAEQMLKYMDDFEVGYVKKGTGIDMRDLFSLGKQEICRYCKERPADRELVELAKKHNTPEIMRCAECEDRLQDEVQNFYGEHSPRTALPN